MNIIAFGDIHMDCGNLAAMESLPAADLVIITGDITNFGSGEDARQIIDQISVINPNILAVPGNLDRPDVGHFLTDKEMNLHGRGREIDSLGIMGVGGSNITPFNTPNEFTEEEIAEFLETGYEMVKDSEHIILVSHTPPFQTSTDLLANGSHVGSHAVRKFIEYKQPALCLTGHIHEANAEDIIGETLILNPGMVSMGGWIEVSTNKNTIQASIRPN